MSAATSDAFVERFVEADGFRIRYLEGGEGDPLVMLHGGGGLDTEFDESHEMLARGFRVIALEMPGWGETPNDRTQSFHELARTIVAAVDAIGLTRFRLFATSIGTAVSLWIAVDHPDRVIAHVLESPAAFRQDARRSEGPPDAATFNWNPAKRRERALEPRKGAFMMKLAADPTDEPLAAAMPGCPVPTLVIFGRHDGMFSPENGAHYTSRLPDCRVVVFEAAAHDLKGDRPQAVTEVVRAFLADPATALPDVVAADS